MFVRICCAPKGIGAAGGCGSNGITGPQKKYGYITIKTLKLLVGNR
jgi:hypothetical protein